MKRKLIPAILLLAAAAILFWALNPDRGAAVETVTPVFAPAVQAVYATGTVAASRMIPISPKIAARLLTLNADEGSRVTKGQILAELEAADVQQNVTEAQANLDLAQKDLNRALKLAKSGAIAKEGLDQAQAGYKTAAAAFDRSKAELSYLQLYAPEDGTIIRRDGEIGELVTPSTISTNGNPVFWLNGGDALRVETEVDEEDIGLVSVGQRVVISADAFPGQVFEGEVAQITPKGDPVARSYRVRVTFKNKSPLMIGMTSETNIITQEKDKAMMVPLTAVKNGHVVKIAAGKAHDVAVRTGIKTQKEVEIVAGLEEGDVIALKYDSTLPAKDGLHLKAAEWKPSSGQQ